jgi:hypothetical protein
MVVDIAYYHNILVQKKTRHNTINIQSPNIHNNDYNWDVHNYTNGEITILLVIYVYGRKKKYLQLTF